MSTKKPSHSFRLQTMSVPELSDGMVGVRLRLNRQGLLHRRRKLKDGPALNAVVAWFLSRPVEEQDRIAREGLAIFEAILEGKGDIIVPPMDPSVPAAGPNDVSAEPISIAQSGDFGREPKVKRKR